MNEPLPPWPPHDEETAAVLAAAASDGSWGRYHGPHLAQLCERLARLQEVEFALACCSGTFAVELALRALKIGAGDEVILASYDFPGNFRAVEAVGARPVLVDILPHNWCLDPAEVEAAMSPTTRAIVASHLHGGLADMPRLMDIAAERGLVVVEDACQAPGAWIAGRMAGSWGDVGVLSFGGSKLLTSGRGGAILTRQAELHQRAKVYCDRGNNAFPLSELQAALLVPQLEKLEGRNHLRRVAVQQLLTATKDLNCLTPLVNGHAMAPSFYKLGWLWDAPAGHSHGGRHVTVDAAVLAFQAAGVPIDTGFRGFSLRSNRRCRKHGDLPHSRRAAEGTLLLHHPILLAGPARIDRLAAAIHTAVERLMPS